MCIEMSVPFLGRIPLDPRIGQCCDEGRSFIKEFPDSLAAIAYKKIIQGIYFLDRIFDALVEKTNFLFCKYLELQSNVESS